VIKGGNVFIGWWGEITGGLEPVNHPVTMFLKGSDRPLVNRGHLECEVAWREE